MAETQQATPAGTISFDQISLRERERAFLLGGTGAGKTTLEELLIADFYTRYPTSRILILDSKPRFRAEYLPNGLSAKRHFRRWKPGPAIPGSVLVRDGEEMEAAWQLGARIVVCQCSTMAERPLLVGAADRFYNDSSYKTPQLLCVDETCDFFQVNGSPIAGSSDSLIRVARAGRELGTAGLYCTQRARSIPSSIIEELSQLYLFYLDGDNDLKRCVEMGAPKWIQPPTEPYEFMFWTKRDRQRVYGPFSVALDENAA